MRYGLEEKIIEQILNVLRNFPEVQSAILYGSRAKGNFKPASDIDITLKGDGITTVILNKISWAFDDLMLPYTFDISAYSHIAQQDLLGHIDRVGIEIYQKDKE